MRSPRARTGWLLLLLAACCLPLMFSGPLQAQQRTQRIIMEDGSYQSALKFETQGDRVHYLSAERYEWEDVPASLVDWDATKKYNADLVGGKLPTKIVETPEEKEEREKEEANSPEIAPGLNLPGSGGVFLFNQFQGKPELAEIVQNGSEVSKNNKRSVLRTAINPMGSNKQAFELKGAHAQVQSHTPRPAIYLDIDEGPQTGTALGDRFRLVRVTAKNDIRTVGTVKVSMSGKVTEQTTVVPTTVSKLGTGEWMKLTPNQDLTPGEYAVVEMLSPEEINQYVWDFGVNTNAPANPNTWQPVAAPATSK